jgi:hypothetical protein
MKNGKYEVRFEVDLRDCKTKEQAIESTREMVSEMIDSDDFPEVDFTLVEELDIEYADHEPEELNF